MECEYLVESRLHTPSSAPDDSLLRGEGLTTKYFAENEFQVSLLTSFLMSAAARQPGATDSDLRECLQAAIRNRRVRESGLVYECRPDNRIAAAILDGFEEIFEKFKLESRSEGRSGFGPRDELKILILLDAMTVSWTNGRRYSRAALQSLMMIAAQLLNRISGGETPPEEGLLVNP